MKTIPTAEEILNKEYYHILLDSKDTFIDVDDIKTAMIEFDKEMYGIKEVTITSINEETKVYHWESDWNGGKIHSGYYFEWIDNINV